MQNIWVGEMKTLLFENKIILWVGEMKTTQKMRNYGGDLL